MNILRIANNFLVVFVGLVLALIIVISFNLIVLTTMLLNGFESGEYISNKMKLMVLKFQVAMERKELLKMKKRLDKAFWVSDQYKKSNEYKKIQNVK